jgi:hypothetical protein
MPVRTGLATHSRSQANLFGWMGLVITAQVQTFSCDSSHDNERLSKMKYLLLTPKFGKVRSLTCGSNSVRNPSGRRKVSLDEFGRRVRGRQFASVWQENCCADFVGFA